MPDDPDVTSEGTPSEPDLTPAPVAVPTAQVPDRPVENVVAEMNRKFGQINQRMDTLTQYLAQTQPAQPALSERDKPATNDELWELAKQGNREAFEVYQTRIAERVMQTGARQLEGQRMVEAQLQTLAARYPVLNDPSHPLSQHASAAYQSLLAAGAPQNRATLLDAVKTAIADRPDLVIAMAQTPMIARPSGTSRARMGQTPATVQHSSPTPTPAKLNQKQLDLAKRMGVSDPAKSLERFHQRQADGKSSLGAVANYIEGEE